MARSIDGCFSTGGPWTGLTSARDRLRMDELRRDCDALLIGPRTLATDNPNVHVKAEPDKSPLPVTILNSTTLDPGLRFFHGPRRALVFSRGENPGFACDWTELKDTEPRSIAAALAQRGIRRLLLEGGPTLARAFFEARLIDRVFITVIPWMLGGVSASFPDERFRLKSCLRQEEEVFLEYEKK